MLLLAGGCTALEDLSLWLRAAAAGDDNTLRDMHAANPSLLESVSPTGHTALHLACAFGKPRAVATLLGLDANVNARTKTDKTPLHVVSDAGDVPELAALLLAAGAEASAREREFFFTPLDLARIGRRTRLAAAIADAGGRSNGT